MADQNLEKFLEGRDLASFNFEPFIKKVEKPWGYEIHFTKGDAPYMGKLLHINKGKRLSLQVHDQKTKSWFLINGRGGVIIENQQGELEEVELKEGFGYTTVLGQKHRLSGVTDCDILEVSTPELGTTYRLEDDYSRTDETEEVRKDPNRGWNN